GSSSGSASGAG
nr:Chain Q, UNDECAPEPTIDE-GSSSGSASGAG [unidentified]